jgi:uncharacterized protein
MAKFVAMGIDGIEPEEYGPDKGSVISGNPRFRLWSLDEAKGGLSITEDGGIAHTVRTGDRFILREGFSGTWEVIETTEKTTSSERSSTWFMGRCFPTG